MAFLLSLITPRVALYAAILAILVGAGAYLYHDGARDAREADRIERLESRIKTKEQADERRNEIDALDDCELVRDGIVRLSGDADAAESEFQRCRADAAASEAGNSGISRPE